jgi:preprotein translocase subunit SecF
MGLENDPPVYDRNWEASMIQRAIGVTVGAIVALVLLVLTTELTLEQAVVPLVIGAIAAWAWPVVIAWYLARRAKARRSNQIEDEVQRQLDEERRRGG